MLVFSAASGSPPGAKRAADCAPPRPSRNSTEHHEFFGNTSHPAEGSPRAPPFRRPPTARRPRFPAAAVRRRARRARGRAVARRESRGRDERFRTDRRRDAFRGRAARATGRGRVDAPRPRRRLRRRSRGVAFKPGGHSRPRAHLRRRRPVPLRGHVERRLSSGNLALRRTRRPRVAVVHGRGRREQLRRHGRRRGLRARQSRVRGRLDNDQLALGDDGRRSGRLHGRAQRGQPPRRRDPPPRSGLPRRAGRRARPARRPPGGPGGTRPDTPCLLASRPAVPL